jgi:translocation and assembly module TamB
VSRPAKIALIAAGAAAGFVLAVVVAFFLIIQTGWFRHTVEQQIVTSTERATGGTAQVGGFSFRWQNLKATIHNFTIHGTEPAGSPPLFHAKTIVVGLNLRSPLTGFVNISSLAVDTPEIHVLIFPDGRTNIPAPKTASKTSTLETIVNLAVGRFDLSNGSITVADRKTSFSARGENLRAHLDYNRANPGYQGNIAMAPLFLQKDKNPPVRADVNLPVTIRKDLLALNNARVTTPGSVLTITAQMEHMASPNGRASVVGRVNLSELNRAAGLRLPLQTKRSPQDLQANVTLVMKHGVIGVEKSRLVLGNSTVDLSSFTPGKNAEPAEFRARLDLSQLGPLFGLPAQPRGTIFANGDFAFRPSGYELHAAVEARDLSVVEGGRRISGIDLVTRATAVPGRIELAGLRGDAMGGVFAGSATIANLRQFRLAGTLEHLDLDRAAHVFTPAHIGYAGSLSGPVLVQGDLRQLASVEGQANFRIAPGRRGVPLSGRLNLSYNGRTGMVTVAPSRLVLPHSSVTLAGSLGRTIQVRLVSRDLADFRPLASPPVTIDKGGVLKVEATVTGSLKAPRIAGQAAMTNFRVDQRPFEHFSGAFDATRSGVAVTNAVLTRGTLNAHFDASVGLRDWKPLPTEPLRVDATLRNGDVADALALAGYGSIAASGALTADVHISGTVGSPVGDVHFSAMKGAIDGTPFDVIQGRATLTQTSIVVPALEYTAGAARLEASGTYQHAVNQLDQGTFRAQVTGSQLPLSRGVSGVFSLQANGSGVVQPSGVLLASLSANAEGHNLMVNGKPAGGFTASASTMGNAVDYTVNSNFAGSNARVVGRTLLTPGHETTAAVNIVNLPVAPAMALAGETKLPVTGTLTASAQVSGTLAAPRVVGTFDLANGSAWGEPFRRAHAALSYSDRLLQINDGRIEKDGGLIEVSGSLAHPPGDYRDGQLVFSVRSSGVSLAQFHTLQSSGPLTGTATFAVNGTAALAAGKAPRFSGLNATITAPDLTLNGAPLGSLTARAETYGRQIQMHLNSNLAGSAVDGTGTIQMSGDYPLNARVTFSGLSYAHLRPLLELPAAPIQTSATGNLTITGPLAQAGGIHGSLEFTQLEVRSAPNAATGLLPRVNLQLRNQGPVRATLANSRLRLDNFRLEGPYAHLTLTGSASLSAPSHLAVHASGTLDMEVLEAFNPDVFSSGSVTVDTGITGTLAHPRLSGSVRLRDASLNVVRWPNGISKANGTITFTEREAIFNNVTGESGGGRVTLGGYIGYGTAEPIVRLEATGEKVYVNYPENVTTEVNARLSLTGTTTRSLLSGTVTILDVALHSQTDIGSVLNSAAAPRATSTPATGFLAGMRFDVRIQTASGAQFRTSLTQNLQADINLTLRGTVDSPGMLGRVVITEGQIVFFGNRYTIEQGTISFYDPQRINPFVNIDLDTTVSGVEVTISVNGPMDRLKMTYRSDPPLAFTDILALLTSGTVTTTDPVLAARQPLLQQQPFPQTGASAILGQAVSTPVAGTLQRLFGVTRLQINPQFVSGYATPRATVSIQQQVTPDLVFTYIQLVGLSNPQIIKVEWTIDRHWSAVVQRDYNGFFYLDFYYRRRFW